MLPNALRPSVAIAPAFVLCCSLGGIEVGIRSPPVALDWNAKVRPDAQEELTTAPFDLGSTSHLIPSAGSALPPHSNKDFAGSRHNY